MISGSLPAGLSLNSSSGVISGTPATDSSYSFTIQAADSSTGTGAPFTQTKNYSIIIAPAPIALSITPTPSTNTQVGVAYSQLNTAIGGTDPYNHSLLTGSLPAGTTLNTSTGTVSGTPTASGAFSYVIRVTDSLGATADTTTISGTIATAAPTVVASDFSVSVDFNSKGQAIDLTSHVTGGITSAAIASAPSQGTATVNGTVINYIPAANYSGDDSFTYTASNGTSTSSAATITINVGARPDPIVTNPEIKEMVTSQNTTVNSFMNAQVVNVNNRLERLHGGIGQSDGIQINKNCTLIPSGEPGDKGSNSDCSAQSFVINSMQQSFGSLIKESFADSDLSWVSAPKDLGISLWSAGVVNFGSTPSSKSTHFTTYGISFGADKKLASNSIIGVSLGYGSSETKIGHDGTASNNVNYNASIYGSYEILKSVFLDGSLGYGKATFNTKRYISENNGNVSGKRNGDEIFGSLSIKKQIPEGNFRFMPYLRMDVLTARLDAYSEKGDPLALKYDDTTINSLTAVGGLRSFYNISKYWGTLTPSLRLEYRRARSQGQSQTVSYADTVGGTSYNISQTNTDTNSTAASVGLYSKTHSGKIIDLEYGVSASKNRIYEQKIMAVLGIEF